MKTLWVFGDSHTAGHGCTPKFEYYQKYYDIGCDIWPNHLSQKLGYLIENKGKNGASNDMILDRIIDWFDSIQKDDIVIIGKTYAHRFDVPQIEGLNAIFWDWDKAPLEYIHSQFTIEQKKCIIDFQYHFMLSPLFEERWTKRMQWIKKVLESKGCKVILWDVNKDIKRCETIYQHTKRKIDDHHMSFKGHRDFSEYLYNTFFKDKTML